MTRSVEFFCDDAGAVTIDWVALTSAMLLLGIMVVYAIFNGGVVGLVSNVNSTLAGVNIVGVGGIDIGTGVGAGSPPPPECDKSSKDPLCI